MSVRATFTIEVSISSMIAAAITVIVMMSLRKPDSAIDGGLNPRPGSVLDADGRVHAHARPQDLAIGTAAVEDDLDRHALGNPDVVAGGVVGREQGETGAGGLGDGF